MNQNKKSFFVAVTILTAIIIGTFSLVYFNKTVKVPATPNTNVSATPQKIYLGEFSAQVANSNSPLELCSHLSLMLNNTTTFWEFDYDHGKNPTDFLVYIFPNIEVAGGTGIVRFTSDETVDTWRIAPTKKGYEAYMVTDPEERNFLIQSAIEETSGNIGYLVTYINITPNTDLKDAIGTCAPIPYK